MCYTHPCTADTATLPESSRFESKLQGACERAQRQHVYMTLTSYNSRPESGVCWIRRQQALCNQRCKRAGTLEFHHRGSRQYKTSCKQRSKDGVCWRLCIYQKRGLGHSKKGKGKKGRKKRETAMVIRGGNHTVRAERSFGCYLFRRNI